MRHPTTHAFMLLLIILLCAGCGAGIRTSAGQTPAQIEADNPGFHLHTSVIKDQEEVRVYRNWSWTSPGSYFKTNRTYRLTFINGQLSSWQEE